MPPSFDIPESLVIGGKADEGWYTLQESGPVFAEAVIKNLIELGNVYRGNSCVIPRLEATEGQIRRSSSSCPH